MTTLWRNARLTTLAPSNGWGLIDNGAVLSEGATRPVSTRDSRLSEHPANDPVLGPP